jgi:hypothetical protein
MPDNQNTATAEPSMASLVSGIIGDAQQLIRQEVALAKREVQEELNKAKVVAISFGTGAVVVVLGGLMFIFMLVHLIHWLSGGRAADPAWIPLWGCYAIAGGLFVLAGGVLFLIAKNKVTQLNLVPRRTVETMKENVQWIKNQT